LLGVRQDVPGVTQEMLPGDSELHVAITALKQSDAQRTFQHLDLPAQRWLGHEQTFGGPTEMQLFGNHHKTAELMEFHDSILVLIDPVSMLDQHRSFSYSGTTRRQLLVARPDKYNSRNAT
jgi:hypothetical protein